MRSLFSPNFVLAIIATAAVSIPGAAFAQVVGADDYEAPADDAPGEASPAPPTEGAGVHPDGQAPAPAPAQRPRLSEGDHTVYVQVSHGADDELDLSGQPVLLEAVQPSGPLRPDGHERVINSWEAVTDGDGIARFDDLPDELTDRRLQLRASTTFGGIDFQSQLQQTGADGAIVELNVFDQAHSYPGVRLSRKRVLVSPWEEYLIFDQFWTLQLEGDQAFDTSVASEFERGLPLRLPYTAEGISVAGVGDSQVIDNIVYWNGVLQPDRPVTIQIRFSMEARHSEFTFEHPMNYPVDNIDVLATVDTNFDKMPRLNDLTLRAPGFEVGDDPTAAGLPPHTTLDFLVATGHSVDRGESYAFRLEGLPFGRPLGAWIALFGGILAALLAAFYGRREYLNMRDANNGDALEGLEAQRDDLIDELAEIEHDIEQAGTEQEKLDFEEERMLVRQRLALILGKIDDLTDDSDTTDADAA